MGIVQLEGLDHPMTSLVLGDLESCHIYFVTIHRFSPVAGLRYILCKVIPNVSYN